MLCVCPTKNPAYLFIDTMRCVSLPKRLRLTKLQQIQIRLQKGKNPDWNHISPAEALEWMCDAWEEMPAKDIKNYWRHAGLYVDRLEINKSRVFLH